MAEQIFHLNERGELDPMSEEHFALEDTLQELVAKYPGLLSGEQMNPDDPRRFILIGREQGIADIIGGSNRWSLDHLLIDQDGVPTLVEAKRQSSSEIRRQIVGQMLDYAAHATKTWNVGDIREAFESRADDPDAELAVLLQEEPDVERFWHGVETNLRAARLRLLFVADGIPDELTRVVEFLNKQMPDIEVLAIEIKQFKGDSGSTLVPRVIGRTSATAQQERRSSGQPIRRRLNREQFLEKFEDVAAANAAQRLMDVTEQQGGIVFFGDSGISLRYRTPVMRSPISVAWIYATAGRASWMNTRDFTFGMVDWDIYDAPDELTGICEKWVSQFGADSFSDDISIEGLRTWAISHHDAAANIDLLCERLDRVLRRLSELQPEQS